jgi:hypothetical protein
MLKVLLRIIAVPILILFIVALPVSLTLRNVGALLFDSETTRALVRESLVGSELAASLARQGTEQMLMERDPAEASPSIELDEEQWRQVTEIIAPERILGDIFDKVVTDFSVWLNATDAQFPEMSIDLTELKGNALQRADEVMAVVLSALPACTAEDALAMAQESGSSSPIPSCAPPEPLYSEIIEQADNLIGRVMGGTPDTIDLSQLTEGQAPSELLELRETLQRLRLVLGWGWAAVLAAGLVAAWMAAVGRRSFLAWLGWPLLLAGLFTLVIGLALIVFSFSFLDQFFATALGEGSAAMSVLGGAMAGGALNLVSQPLLLQGLVTTICGIAALLYARALRKQEESPGIAINRRKIGL